MDLLGVLQTLQSTPIPNLLVVGGFIFLFLAFVGRFGAFISLPQRRQLWAGVIGVVFLLAGIGLFLVPPPPPPSPTPTTPPTVVPTAVPTVIPSPTPTPTQTPTCTPSCRVGDTCIRTFDAMVMMCVPAGTFQMGSETGHDDEKHVHSVTLDAFWIDRTEVTNAQYAKCVFAGECVAPSETKSYTHDSYYGNSQYDNYPVIYVSWNDADKYCKWAGGELPTEAQWEYAARGPQNYIYPWGNTFDGGPLNFCDKNCLRDGADKTVDDGYADTAPVGSYSSGASWVYALDLAGNVWEWVQDWYGPYSASAQTNPTGPTSGTLRVLRGGAWYDIGAEVRAVRRNTGFPDFSYDGFGFRCMAKGPGK